MVEKIQEGKIRVLRMYLVVLIRALMIQASVILVTKTQEVMMMILAMELKHWAVFAGSVYYSFLLSFLKLVEATKMSVMAMPLK